MKPGAFIVLPLLIFSLTACNTSSGSTRQPVETAFLPATAGAAATSTPVPEAPAASPTAAASATVEATASSTPTPSLPPTASPSPTGVIPGSGSVARLPDPAGYDWQPVASGLGNSVGLANAGDGSGRLFALEKRGTIRIVKDGQVLPDPFLDITDRVGSASSEQGLLGLAFHPKYKENGFFYANYTDQNGDTVIARFHVTSDPDRANPGSEKKLLGVDQPYANHNGGSMVFGPDGYLYMGLGDGGSGGDPHGNGQSLQTHLGKILRIDVDHGDPYSVPPDNPFANGGGLPEIWAYGLRNPWRFSFDRLTGDVYIGDVGQNQWEEIDFLPAGSPGGANFGWNYREGLHPYQGNPPPDLKLTDPVAEYDHSQGCSLTGGYVYRGGSLPDWQGVYLYGDYCTGIVWGLLHGPDGSWQNEQMFQVDARITSFGEDEAGEVYLVDQGGNLFRLSKK